MEDRRKASCFALYVLNWMKLSLEINYISNNNQLNLNTFYKQSERSYGTTGSLKSTYCLKELDDGETYAIFLNQPCLNSCST